MDYKNHEITQHHSIKKAVNLSRQLMESFNSYHCFQLLANYLQGEVVKSDGIKIIQLGRDGELGTYTEYLYHSLSKKFTGKRSLVNRQGEASYGLIEGGLSAPKGMIVSVEQCAGGEFRYRCHEPKKAPYYRVPVNEGSCLEDGNLLEMDNEKYMLLYPLITYSEEDKAKKVIGMIFLWRDMDEDNEPPAYDNRDLKRLNFILPFLLLAFEHILKLELHKKEKRCLTHFFKSFEPNISIADALAIILNQIGELSGARHLLLLEQNSNSDSTFYSIANWSYPIEKEVVDSVAEFKSVLHHYYYDGKYRGICDDIQGKVKALDLTVRSDCLLADVPEYGLYDGVKPKRWIIVLLDKKDSGYEKVLPAYLWGNPSLLTELFISGVNLFCQYLEAHIRYKVKRLANFHVNKSCELSGQNKLKSLLQNAADEIKTSINCEAILIYHEEFVTRVLCTAPYNEKLIDISIDDISLSATALESGETQFVFDMQATYSSKPNFNLSKLKEIAYCLGVEEINSWLAAPIAEEKNNDEQDNEDQVKRGIIKVVTSIDQPYLNVANAKLLDAIAQRTFRQASELQNHHMLVALNDICNDLAPLQGQKMSSHLVAALRDKWLRPFIRHDCELVVLTRTTKGDQLVYGNSAGIPILTTLQQQDWQYLSQEISDGLVHTFAPNELLEFAEGKKLKIGLEAMAVPIEISGDKELCGHFFLFSKKKLKGYQAEHVKQAVKELSAILYQEKQIHDWRADAGMYRHIILSATQGVVSNAKLINKKVKSYIGDDVKSNNAKIIRRSIAQINSEVVKIRNWTHFQRVLYADRIEPHFSLSDLRVDLETWTARFQEMADNANILLEFAVNRKMAMARYDRTLIDVAFSNLIENAIKYSANMSKVYVYFEHQQEQAIIKVVNVGQSIPDSIKRDIFKYGNRGELQDKQAERNTIPGQGIGLYLAKKMVESHIEGSLLVKSKPNYAKTGIHDEAFNTFIIKFNHQLSRAERTKWITSL